MPKQTNKIHTSVTVIAPEGFGFGDGKISTLDQIERRELHYQQLRSAIDLVMSDPSLFVAVDSKTHDDGCGDGRGATRTYRFLDPVTKKSQTLRRQIHRAKLFGGGLIAASSMWRAVDGLPTKGQTLDGDRKFIASELHTRAKRYGAHTDTIAEGNNCGCGAIDRYEDISRSIIRYEREITATLMHLYGRAFAENEAAIKSVFDMYKGLSADYFDGVTGRSTIEFIESDGAIIKQLGGEHTEAIAIINSVDESTFDQACFRELLLAEDLPASIQAFTIDEWRGREYAEVVADIAEEYEKDRKSAYSIAYADFLIRTLAVSATLTKGDQPVLLRQAAVAEPAHT